MKYTDESWPRTIDWKMEVSQMSSNDSPEKTGSRFSSSAEGTGWYKPWGQKNQLGGILHNQKWQMEWYSPNEIAYALIAS